MYVSPPINKSPKLKYHMYVSVMDSWKYQFEFYLSDYLKLQLEAILAWIWNPVKRCENVINYAKFVIGNVNILQINQIEPMIECT